MDARYHISNGQRLSGAMGWPESALCAKSLEAYTRLFVLLTQASDL